ncbi:hypothetical protein [Kushneria aurantia]|uniref:Uncharacterized protein n=1 Tax=Kushneria aurantia TaxID=504092 RepID=A0ABV6G4H1_9GAMM|nr:hypothetical protein [Kushneria aurantia]
MLIVRKGIAVLAIAGTALALSGCAGSAPREQSPSADTNTNITASSSAPEQHYAGYRNTDAGYTFMYPENWQGYIVQDDTLEWRHGRLDAENVMVFFYKDFERNSEPVPLLALAVYSKADWAELQNRSLDRHGEDVGHAVGVKGDRVLVAYINNHNPYDPRSPMGQEFASRVPTPEQVAGAISW